jgi:hypothetical protein
MAYFPAAALWMLVNAVGEKNKENSESWRAWVYALAGLLFILQALIQLVKYLQRTAREKNLEAAVSLGETSETHPPDSSQVSSATLNAEDDED